MAGSTPLHVYGTGGMPWAYNRLGKGTGSRPFGKVHSEADNIPRPARPSTPLTGSTSVVMFVTQRGLDMNETYQKVGSLLWRNPLLSGMKQACCATARSFAACPVKCTQHRWLKLFLEKMPIDVTAAPTNKAKSSVPSVDLASLASRTHRTGTLPPISPGQRYAWVEIAGEHHHKLADDLAEAIANGDLDGAIPRKAVVVAPVSRTTGIQEPQYHQTPWWWLLLLCFALIIWWCCPKRSNRKHVNVGPTLQSQALDRTYASDACAQISSEQSIRGEVDAAEWASVQGRVDTADPKSTACDPIQHQSRPPPAQGSRRVADSLSISHPRPFGSAPKRHHVTHNGELIFLRLPESEVRVGSPPSGGTKDDLIDHLTTDHMN
jgi:hypothetical protein